MNKRFLLKEKLIFIARTKIEQCEKTKELENTLKKLSELSEVIGKIEKHVAN